MCYLAMNHVQIWYVLVVVTIFYKYVLILASIDSLSLIELCLILFAIIIIITPTISNAP